MLQVSIDTSDDEITIDQTYKRWQSLDDKHILKPTSGFISRIDDSYKNLFVTGLKQDDALRSLIAYTLSPI